MSTRQEASNLSHKLHGFRRKEKHNTITQRETYERSKVKWVLIGGGGFGWAKIRYEDSATVLVHVDYLPNLLSQN